MWRALHRHPESRGGDGLQVQARAERLGEAQLSLEYRVIGGHELAELVLPTPVSPERTDDLWRTTCFEAFILAGVGGYYELNLAPSTQWAAYRFEAYRTGMRDAELPPPNVKSGENASSYELRVDVDPSGWADLPPEATWVVGLSAVLEHADGGRSYWALAHPAGKPDFHHPDSFVLELPAPA